MATHTQIGSVTVDAFQWNGGTLAAATLPGWAAALALQTPGDGTLDVPTTRGTFKAGIGDWVIRYASGETEIVSNATFVLLYV